MKTPINSPIPRKRWPGYTIDELRCRRTLVAADIMVTRHDLATQIKRIRGDVFRPRHASTVVGRIFGAMSYMDWALLAISLWRRISRLRRR